jgi:hypothetical protein
MVNYRMNGHIHHTERSEQESEDVRLFLVLAAKGLRKALRYQGCPMNAWLIELYLFMSTSHFLCGIPAMRLTLPQFPALKVASLDRTCSQVGTGQQTDKVLCSTVANTYIYIEWLTDKMSDWCQSEAIRRKKRTVIKNIHKLGQLPSIDIAFTVCQNGQYTIYQSVDPADFPPSKEQIISKLDLRFR